MNKILDKEKDQKIIKLLEYFQKHEPDMFTKISLEFKDPNFITYFRKMIFDITQVFKDCAFNPDVDVSKYEGDIYIVLDHYPILRNVIHVYLTHISIQDLNPNLHGEELKKEIEKLQTFFNQF